MHTSEQVMCVSCSVRVWIFWSASVQDTPTDSCHVSPFHSHNKDVGPWHTGVQEAACDKLSSGFHHRSTVHTERPGKQSPVFTTCPRFYHAYHPYLVLQYFFKMIFKCNSFFYYCFLVFSYSFNIYFCPEMSL